MIFVKISHMFEFDNALSENSMQKETFDVIAEDVYLKVLKLEINPVTV